MKPACSVIIKKGKLYEHWSSKISEGKNTANRICRQEATLSGLSLKGAKYDGQSPKDAKTSGLVYTLCLKTATDKAC